MTFICCYVSFILTSTYGLGHINGEKLLYKINVFNQFSILFITCYNYILHVTFWRIIYLMILLYWAMYYNGRALSYCEAVLATRPGSVGSEGNYPLRHGATDGLCFYLSHTLHCTMTALKVYKITLCIIHRHLETYLSTVYYCHIYYIIR